MTRKQGAKVKLTERELLGRVIEGKDTLITSHPILAELHEVLLRPKFGMDEDHAELYIREVEEIPSRYGPTGRFRS